MVQCLLITMATFLVWDALRIVLNIWICLTNSSLQVEIHQRNSKAAENTRLRIILISIAFGVLSKIC